MRGGEVLDIAGNGRDELFAVLSGERAAPEAANVVIDGAASSASTTCCKGGLKSEMVVMAPFTNMPDDVKALAEKTEAGINDGSIVPYKGPVVDQDGKTVECKGAPTSTMDRS